MSNNITIIINPISGTTDKKAVERYVRERFEQTGATVETILTRGAGDATHLASEAAKSGAKAVVAIGGDGTVNECSRGLIDTNVPLGIIPSGSGNGLARHLGIPLDVQKAMDIIQSGNVADCDYGVVNNHPFFCTCGVGFDAIVSEKFAESKRRGKMSYVNTAIKEYFRYKPEEYVIIADEKVLTERALLVAVCNGSQYGNNAYIAPAASVTDGLLDITVIHYDNLITTAFAGVELLTGYIGKTNLMSHTIRASKITIHRKNGGPVHIDGEPFNLDESLNIYCHKGGLRLFASKNEADFKPILTPMLSMIQDIHNDMRRLFGISK